MVKTPDFLKKRDCQTDLLFKAELFIFTFRLPTEGGQYLCSGEGMFRRPSEGQSLISYLSEQDFGSCADLEKVRNPENLRAHESGDLRGCGAICSIYLFFLC